MTAVDKNSREEPTARPAAKKLSDDEIKVALCKEGRIKNLKQEAEQC